MWSFTNKSQFNKTYGNNRVILGTTMLLKVYEAFVKIA